MTLSFSLSKSRSHRARQLAVCFVFDGKKNNLSTSSSIDARFSKRITQLIQRKTFTPSLGACFLIDDASSEGVLVVGLGKPNKYSINNLRAAAGSAARYLRSHRFAQIAVDGLSELESNDISESDLFQVICEGAALGDYQFTRYQAEKAEERAKYSADWQLISANRKRNHDELKAAIQRGQSIANGMNWARDLANTPGNDLLPADIVAEAKAKFKAHSSIKVEVIDAATAKKKGMNAFLGVAQGSDAPPSMLVMRYQGGKKGEAPIALVGKGVTFDTGGISIKPSNGMSEMKGDMGGAAAVLGTMLTVAELKIPQNILAITPVVENMPSGGAQRPGDVVKAMNGKTIEILNTDAEGRLILADALCYAVEEGAGEIIDLATLTGACLVALGTEAIAIMGNKQSFVNQVKAAGDSVGERHWQLPLYDEFKDYLKSDIADMTNCVENRMAGTATAGKFLEQFVDKTPWVHLDIASLMANDKSSGYRVKGMAGAGVLTLSSYLLSRD